MKDKKKTGLWKRVAAVLCAVILVGCFESPASYSASDLPFWGFPSLDDVLKTNIYDKLDSSEQVEPLKCECLILEVNGYYFAVVGDRFVYRPDTDSKPDILGIFGYGFDYESCSKLYRFRLDGDDWVLCGSTSAPHSRYVAEFCMGYRGFNGLNSDTSLLDSCNLLYSSCDIYDSDGVLHFKASTFSDMYNSSIGYLQNIQKKNLTIDGEDYNPDYDSWRVMFSFDSMSTTGLDITNGEYSVRHFMSWEVRDKDGHIIRTYDKVSCGEYDAVDCKLSYPLYTTRQAAMDECGFESLSWWESGVLGYKVYIYDYLQLVRTNADGSVEYGGYVRIDENGYVADTLDDNFTEDPDGYLDKDVPNSSGSGSNYDDAEHDADNNASGSSGAGSDVVGEINDVLSTVMAVPEIFARMFSFLPDWCLDFLGISVALAGALLVWKVARG